MSGIMKFFGAGKGKDKAPSTGEAIQSLRETEEMLMKKQEFLEKKIEAEVAVARKHAKTNKRMALSALKKKKRLESQLTQIDGTLTTIEQQRETLESANTNTAVLTTMGAAAKALSAANADMDVDKVHDMMDDIVEQQEVAKEISDAISSPVGMGLDMDEDELEAELNELEAEADAAEQEELDRELLKVTPTPAVSLPDVPKAEPAVAAVAPKKVAVAAEEDDDMAELAAWAS